MTWMKFGEAIDAALAEAMSRDERIVVFGEDVPMIRAELFARFGDKRVFPAPISEAAFVGAAVGAAMAGLRPIVELMMVDFAAVAMDSILNNMAKLEVFSGGSWTCPLVVRANCGAGYGDGGQHGQVLWGTFAGIPGLTVVAPSTPGDAAGLMMSAIEHDGPVIYLEHKLLSEAWRESLGGGGRETVSFDVPEEGAEGSVRQGFPTVPFGEAAIRRTGDDLTIVSVAVGVHRALAAAEQLEEEGIGCDVLDLRCLSPLDVDTVVESVAKTEHLLVVDEDYREFGLSGELAAAVLESGLKPAFARVCVDNTIPYARHLEEKTLPNVPRILEAARRIRRH